MGRTARAGPARGPCEWFSARERARVQRPHSGQPSRMIAPMPTRRDVALGLPAAALLAALPGRVHAQDTYSQDEIVAAASDALDTTAGAVAAAVERVFRDNGRPVGYVQGEEGSAAWGFGLRYGQGLLFLKSGERADVAWQGPSFGWDFGGNASKVFTLVYGMTQPDQIYRRFPGVEGSAYFIGGIGVNYQRAENIILAPMRAGVGLRAGANVGYLAYSRKRRINPF